MLNIKTHCLIEVSKNLGLCLFVKTDKTLIITDTSLLSAQITYKSGIYLCGKAAEWRIVVCKQDAQIKLLY